MTSDSLLSDDHQPLGKWLLGDGFHPGGLSLTHDLAVQTLVDEDTRVLDVPAGQWDSANYLARRFGATVYALDTGAEHHRLCSSGNVQPQSGKVYGITGLPEHLPIAGEAFDVVFCQSAMSTFKHREKVLTEIYRVLKPRGFIALSDVFINEPPPGRLSADINRLLGTVSAFNARRCREIVEQNGFNQIRFVDVSSQLLETLHTIETRLAVTDSTQVSSKANQGLPFSSQLAQHIYDGRIGYYTLSARKPQ